LLIKKF